MLPSLTTPERPGIATPKRRQAMGRVKMLPNPSGNNRVPWPCAQKRWIRSVFALAQIKANPRDPILGTLCRAAQGRP